MRRPASQPAASYLFVPATRLDRVEKARRSEADEVIVDLEDGVAAADKAAARAALAQVPDGRPVHVRVNPPGTPHHEADVEALASVGALRAIVVPKVETADAVRSVAAAIRPGTAVVALIETARGVVAAEAIAGAGIARIIFGIADYLADIGADRSPEVLAYPRSRLVVASRAAGLPAPVDGPTLVTGDDAVVRAEAEEAKRLGMGAKLCIHPAQVAAVNAVFRSSDDQRRWAHAVLEAAEAHGGGAFTFEGAMVDEPVLIRARQLLAADSTA